VALGEQLGHPALERGDRRTDVELARPEHLDDRRDLPLVVDGTGWGKFHGSLQGTGRRTTPSPKRPDTDRSTRQKLT
jgi:hypothetical protein